MSEQTLTRAAVVTGGSRGIGRAVCTALAKQGVNVVVNYCHGAEPAEQTAALCRARLWPGGYPSEQRGHHPRQPHPPPDRRGL